jgi:hypothetical protein
MASCSVVDVLNVSEDPAVCIFSFEVFDYQTTRYDKAEDQILNYRREDLKSHLIINLHVRTTFREGRQMHYKWIVYKNRQFHVQTILLHGRNTFRPLNRSLRGPQSRSAYGSENKTSHSY